MPRRHHNALKPDPHPVGQPNLNARFFCELCEHEYCRYYWRSLINGNRIVYEAKRTIRGGHSVPITPEALHSAQVRQETQFGRGSGWPRPIETRSPDDLLEVTRRRINEEGAQARNIVRAPSNLDLLNERLLEMARIQREGPSPSILTPPRTPNLLSLSKKRKADDSLEQCIDSFNEYTTQVNLTVKNLMVCVQRAKEMKAEYEKLIESKECKICADKPFSQSLECGHTFCETCIEKFKFGFGLYTVPTVVC